MDAGIIAELNIKLFRTPKIVVKIQLVFIGHSYFLVNFAYIKDGELRVVYVLLRLHLMGYNVIMPATKILDTIKLNQM